MGKVEEIMEKQLEEFRKNFRPAFGNQKHIEIIKQSSKLGDLEKELGKTMTEAEKAKRLRDEIMRAKRNLLFSFKNL